MAVIDDSVILFGLRNIKLDVFEEAFLSENLTNFIAVLRNTREEIGHKYLGNYLKYPAEYEVMSIADVQFKDRIVKADWKTCGILEDLLEGDNDGKDNN